MQAFLRTVGGKGIEAEERYRNIKKEYYFLHDAAKIQPDSIDDSFFYFF